MGEKERPDTKRKVKEIRGRKEREEGGREGGRKVIEGNGEDTWCQRLERNKPLRACSDSTESPT